MYDVHASFVTERFRNHGINVISISADGQDSGALSQSEQPFILVEGCYHDDGVIRIDSVLEERLLKMLPGVSAGFIMLNGAGSRALAEKIRLTGTARYVCFWEASDGIPDVTQRGAQTLVLQICRRLGSGEPMNEMFWEAKGAAMEECGLRELQGVRLLEGRQPTL
eukprot:gnl/TRDRNA2_/TRDRNA2_145595_c0_seq1.p1 gnl/TRDRNA2_/TRDRNA2_145595_c0~~gnl/TRDRNA2_/TRDRNA2_145595_c0_seq1.p1  ORF type:complete len:178 (-),score=6.41 gnl/TRDRNA2_/TRDRNA2_145595_c0_seq1:43-540(-)